MEYYVENHNGTELGVFDNLEDAKKEAKFYTDETGNSTLIVDEKGKYYFESI